MPRKGHVAKREVLPDPLYNSTLVTKLVNSIMLDGKKGVAEKIVYGAVKRVEEKSGRNRLEVFDLSHGIASLNSLLFIIVMASLASALASRSRRLASIYNRLQNLWFYYMVFRWLVNRVSCLCKILQLLCN